MAEWGKQMYFEDVAPEQELPPVSIPISLQRMVMEAGSNRDLSSLHHDRDAAVATGAKDVYANTYFIMGMIERMVREWMGLKGFVKKIGPLQMKTFNCVGSMISFKGKIVEIVPEDKAVVLDISAKVNDIETVASKVTLILPGKN